MGELGWDFKRYRKSSLYEFNLAAAGYWRNRERNVLWLAREIVFELIRGNPYYKAEDKPKRKTDLMEFEMDKKPKPEKKDKQLTEEDLRMAQLIGFNKK